MAKFGTTVSRLTCSQMYPHHDMSGQVCSWSDVMSGQHHVTCIPQLKKSSGHGKMIDPHGQLLHHERPFTKEDTYLVCLVLDYVNT